MLRSGARCFQDGKFALHEHDRCPLGVADAALDLSARTETTKK